MVSTEQKRSVDCVALPKRLMRTETIGFQLSSTQCLKKNEVGLIGGKHWNRCEIRFEMAQGSARSTIIEHLISLTGGLPLERSG